MPNIERSATSDFLRKTEIFEYGAIGAGLLLGMPELVVGALGWLIGKKVVEYYLDQRKSRRSGGSKLYKKAA